MQTIYLKKKQNFETSLKSKNNCIITLRRFFINLWINKRIDTQLWKFKDIFKFNKKILWCRKRCLYFHLYYAKTNSWQVSIETLSNSIQLVFLSSNISYALMKVRFLLNETIKLIQHSASRVTFWKP